MPDLIPSWMLDCLNTIRTWLKTSLVSEIVINDWQQVFLRAEVDHQHLQFSASPDGKLWSNVGPVLDASKLSDDYGAGLHFTGAMVGVCAQDVGGGMLNADFDYFDYCPNAA